MSRTSVIILASVLSCPFVFADGINAPEKNLTIGAKDASLFYNQTATVTGKVAQVTFRPTVVFVNLDEAYPNSPFTGVILSANTNEFEHLERLQGRNVEIIGTIKNYQNRPEIILTNQHQLVIISPDKVDLHRGR